MSIEKGIAVKINKFIYSSIGGDHFKIRVKKIFNLCVCKEIKIF
jgi:hypothetical protein